MAAKKKTNSIGGEAKPKPKPKSSGAKPGSPRPTPAVAARRDFMTGKTGMGSGRPAGSASSSWQSQYNLEMSRLKRTATTKSGMGSGRPSKDGSEGPKKRKSIIPKTK